MTFIFRSLQAVTSVCQCAAAINKKTRFTSSASVPRPTRTIYCNLMLSRSKAYYTLCIILGSAAGQRSTSGWKYTSCGVGGIKCTRERIIFVTDQYQHQWVICAQLLAMFFFIVIFPWEVLLFMWKKWQSSAASYWDWGIIRRTETLWSRKTLSQDWCC